MRRFPFGLAIFVLAIVFVAIGIRMNTDFNRTAQVERVKTAPSAFYLKLLVRYDKPPIYDEEYAMQDVEGVSSFAYRVRGYDGKQITVTAPPAAVFDVSFFVSKLVQEGVWNLTNLPDAGDTSARYTFYIKQKADYREGQRTVTFTDPHYWATLAGRQYEIHLDKKAPTPDLLHLQGTTRADPRYEKLVEEFEAFGPPQFRAHVAQARAAIVSGR